MSEKSKTHDTVWEGVWARVDSLDMEVDRGKYPEGRLSMVNMADLAYETGTSVRWLLTGERDPYEPKMFPCNNVYPFDE